MAGETQENQELYRRIMFLVEYIEEISTDWSIKVSALKANSRKIDYHECQPVQNMHLQPKKQVDLGRLSLKLGKYFNDAEIRGLAFHLSIDYENLKGSTKGEKLQSLLEYCSRHDCIESLVKECNKSRPNIDWLNLRKNSYYVASSC